VRPVDRLRKSFVDVQPPDSTEVDLAPSPESIFASFKSRSRRNIRKAARKGVSVQASEDIDLWYDLYRTTAERDRIAIHSREYYRSVFVTARNDPSVQVELLLAFYETTPLAGIVVAYTGKQAVYLYGASSNEHRETMPAYALQWEAIKRARERGCHVYDLFGIPPSEDPSHPMHGLYQFKVGFGGRIVHRAGCWDYPTKPAAYFIYREAERVRDFYYKTLKKRR
jgi:lipid II:glycine glycyltransferase (peptidoglycan interpeptide bridge formation enzyme)